MFCQVDAQSSVTSAIEQKEKFDSFSDEASLTEGCSHSDSDFFSSYSTRSDGFSANKLLSPPKTDRFEYFQGTAPTPDILSSMYNMGASGLDEYLLPISDSMNFSYDQTLGFPVQTPNSFIDETDTHVFDDQAHHFFEHDNHPPCLDKQLEIPGKAQKRWRMLCNVLKWFLVKKKKPGLKSLD